MQTTYTNHPQRQHQASWLYFHGQQHCSESSPITSAVPLPNSSGTLICGFRMSWVVSSQRLELSSRNLPMKCLLHWVSNSHLQFLGTVMTSEMLQYNTLTSLKLLSFSSALTICIQWKKVESLTLEPTKDWKSISRGIKCSAHLSEVLTRIAQE